MSPNPKGTRFTRRDFVKTVGLTGLAVGTGTVGALVAPQSPAEAAKAEAAKAAQEVLPRPEPPFRGKIGRTTKDSTPDFPKEVRGPQGSAQHPADHDRRRGLWRRQHLRRADPHADLRPAGRQRPALYNQFHTTRPLLAHPGGAAHRAQPSYLRHRRQSWRWAPAIPATIR